MSAALPVPGSAQSKAAFLSANSKTARGFGKRATLFQLWTLCNTDSAYSYAGTGTFNSSFAMRDPSTVVNAVKARNWTDDSGGFNYYSGSAVETPASYSSPWNNFFGSVCNADNEYFMPIFDSSYSGAFNNPLLAAMWGGMPNPPFGGLGGCSFWAYSPKFSYASGYSSEYWQNVMLAGRSRYRIDGYAGIAWEASCELWWQNAFASGGASWVYGFGNHPYEAQTMPPGVVRMYPRNCAFRKFFSPTIFWAGTSSPTDTTTAWNEVLLPAAGDTFYSTASTNPSGNVAMDGFIGRIIFHVIGETPEAWQARTGFVLAGYP